MRMLRILPAEVGKKLAELELQVVRQRLRDAVCLFELDFGLALIIQLEYDVAEPLEVRIHIAVERDLGVRQRETTDLGVVITELQRGNVLRGRPAGIRQRYESDVHVRPA